ncbi:ARP2/3 complex 16 kDa subunit (p16-Arc)-domain-containing protein [Cantharellus anzutake]|uniref:ARP2/3 complex 16 kDa subunit (p16-Arc)-domain-containing protein n=1 Tax=Cantharellus anzutake TaxID=1750568 RepID=UPI001907A887|nr:ARP2/3 complex 16 kDa subunit (p16-Arc)-domain-containing protein [Cantharellus anzutake]KAF8331995.1 ARP2/3 complex 16 kDa subunit (p16-Arc)-domain-containing protein [Cantharellus anzutake]
MEESSASCIPTTCRRSKELHSLALICKKKMSNVQGKRNSSVSSRVLWLEFSMDVAFRKIDIDALEEDILVESELYEPDPRGAAIILNDTKQKSAQVRSFLSKSDIPSALNVILSQAPFGTGVDEAKSLALNSVLLILNSTKATDISGILRALNQDQQDTLMKYIYKGMGAKGLADVNGNVLLNWHEKLTEVAGIGCIVRVMTDRRTV